MTQRETAFPELMARLFRRVRVEISPEVLGELRFSHVRVLMYVPPDGTSVTALAQAVGMSKQGCGQFVTQLLGTGHLQVSADPSDRRVRLVRRTDLGDDFLDAVTADLSRVAERFSAEVGTRRFATFTAVLAELTAHPS